MSRIESFTREASFSTSAKAISIVFLVAMIALFTTHSSLPTGEVALVPAPTQQSEQSATNVATAAARRDSANQNHAGAKPSKL